MMEQHSYTGDYTNRYKFNGKELDEETGFYYYGARYYNPKFSIWLSVDPLAEKFPNVNPYVYCNDNPVNLVDLDGMQADDWKDKNGKTLNQGQLNKVKVYIFYNPKASGDDGGFAEQTMMQYDAYEKEFGKGSVALSDAMTTKDFASDWGDISGNPNIVSINHHGNNQTLMLDTNPDGNSNTNDGQYIVSTSNGKSPTSQTPSLKVSDLPDTKGDISKSVLKLNTCNSNNTDSLKPGTTLAKSFSKDTEVGVLRGTNKKVNYDSSGNPKTQWYYGGTWQFFRKGVQLTTEQIRNLRL